MSIQHNVFQVFIEAADDPCSNGTLLALSYAEGARTMKTKTNLKAGLIGAAPKLYEAACKGTHLPEVTIELW
jgi:type VI protein secretion system component Hcp